jgi:hypothetical protein
MIVSSNLVVTYGPPLPRSVSRHELEYILALLLSMQQVYRFCLGRGLRHGPPTHLLSCCVHAVRETSENLISLVLFLLYSPVGPHHYTLT